MADFRLCWSRHGPPTASGRSARRADLAEEHAAPLIALHVRNETQHRGGAPVPARRPRWRPRRRTRDDHAHLVADVMAGRDVDWRFEVMPAIPLPNSVKAPPTTAARTDRCRRPQPRRRSADSCSARFARSRSQVTRLRARRARTTAREGQRRAADVEELASARRYSESSDVDG